MKKEYKSTDLSDKLCANPNCRKQLKKRLEHLDFCYSCLQAKKQSKKHSNGEKNGNSAKHFEIVNQREKNGNCTKYTIKLKTVKAVNVFKYAFKTVPNVKLNGIFSLNTSDYKTFLANLQYWE